MMAQPGYEQDTFKSLLESYLSRVHADALQKVRGRAWDHFLELGLPTKSTEVYRYIKLRHLFAQPYQLAEESDVKLEQILEFVYPECQQSYLVFVNGHFRPHLSNREAIPSKVTITTLQEASKTFGAFLNNHWAKSIKEEKDSFALLNTALQRNGAFIYVPTKTVVEVPVQILHVINPLDQPLMMVPRINVFVGAQSQLNLASSQFLANAQSCFVNHVIEMMIEEDAHVHYTQMPGQEHSSAWHFDALRATLKRNATLKTVAITEGAMTVRQDYRVELAGENAEALLNGMWMLNGKREAHTNVFIDHQAPYCRSYQLFKGVLNQFSRSSFEGKIMVRQPAQKTEAFQLNNNLLLSDHAHADSKPNLEIFADDVKASHGATVGQLDVDQLFYLRTRGLSDKEAKNLLIYGFCEQVIELIPIPSLKMQMTEWARQYLMQGNA